MRQASLEPRLEYVTCRVRPACTAWPWEWGDPANDQVLVCVHGLTRTGRDFDALARRLAASYRVVCPDVVGRGRSDWLANPRSHRAAVRGGHGHADRAPEAGAAGVGRHVDGGLIGMALSGSAVFSAAAAMRPHPGMPSAQEGLRFDRMVLNDVGPGWSSARWPASASTWACRASSIPSSRRSRRCAPIRCRSGRTATSNGRRARHVYPEQDGRWVNIDLALAQPLAAQTPQELAAGEQLLWQCYVGTDCPVLIVRGEQSDLLTTVTVDEMLQRNPRARAVVMPGVGHAPTLMSDAQIEPVAAFLLD